MQRAYCLWEGHEMKGGDVGASWATEPSLLFGKSRWPEGFPGGSGVKNLPAKSGDPGDLGSIPELRRFPGGGHGNPVQ